MRRAAMAGVLACAAACAEPALARPISEDEAAELRAEIARLKSLVEALERRVGGGEPPAVANAAPIAPPASAPASSPPYRIEWKGSPRVAEGDRSFKVKGRIQADANVISHPDGLTDRGLGFSSEFRRIRLGGEGDLGSGIGYKLELELSDNAVDLVDTFVTYRSGPLLLTLGNHNAFQSLDELIGDTGGSVMERAAFTDAFNFERRLGFSAQLEQGPLLAQAGIFTDDPTALANSSDGPSGGDENNSFSIDGRLVYAPRIGKARMHVAGSGHWRRLGRTADATVRYRQRPFVHSSNSRLIGTSALAVREEASWGVEVAAVRGPWHAAAEAHWLHARRTAAPTARFWGGYAELGYFLTPGDSRPYDRGIFGAAKPARPLGKGGIGAVQVNLRYDHLSLDSEDIRGGRQNAYVAALIWTPIQYLRFNLNYARLAYRGATPLADGRRDYALDVIGSRFELDF